MSLINAKNIITELSKTPNLSIEKLHKIFISYPRATGSIYSKSELLELYTQLTEANAINLPHDARLNFLNNITMKKIRTLSGVTTVTVLTKPFPCPGKCIFCPNDVRMPKSYISSEPGAQRAATNNFDPYDQTFRRLLALEKIGHPTDKVELIILGGTWSSYTQDYQIWFVKRCFDALNDFSLTADKTGVAYIKPLLNAFTKEALQTEVKSENGVTNYNLSVALKEQTRESATWAELARAQNLNESAESRCVGLVIETRPDEITLNEVVRIRRLGATKVQLGVQSLNNTVLRLNKRGHTVVQTAKAFALLRGAGFKIHAHYMPNLYGSSPAKDIKDFAKLFDDPRFRPDELKIYPCSLIDGTELMTIYKQGKWRPYSKEELLQVLASCLAKIPRYCRVTRMIRDIPSQEIVDGNKATNFRQLVEDYIKQNDIKLEEIRSREIKELTVSKESLQLKETWYQTANSEEVFIEFVTKEDLIAGFLRLSFPLNLTSKTLKAKSDIIRKLSELKDAAIIREVHVYGASVELGDTKIGAAQHTGLGTKLIQCAISMAIAKKVKKLAVISSIGTKKYYERFGFEQTGLYQTMNLP